MSNDPSPPAAPPAAPVKASSRLRRDQSSLLLDAKATSVAVAANLSAFVAADAGRAVKRIDASWLSRFNSMLAAAETAIDGRAVRLGELKAATSTERANAADLANEIRAIRDDISTSYPGDEGIGRAFGFGAAIDPKKTSPLLQLAGQLAGSFASPQWNARATDAGVTQARIDAMTALRSALSGADVSQQGVFATNTDGTVQKDALLQAVSGSTAYARKVAGVVLKGNGTALAAFTPVCGRAAKAVKAAKAKTPAAAAPAKAKKKKLAKGKQRARRADVKARAKKLVTAPAAAARVAKKTSSKKASGTKRAK